MRLITYNILNPYHAVKWSTAEGLDAQGGSNWEAWRREAVTSNLRGAQADVLCLQEVSARTLAELSAALSPALAVATHALHDTDEPEGAHGVAVLYRPDTIELLAARAYESGGEPLRVCASADLRCRRTGRVVRALSVHLKGYNPSERDPARRRDSQRVGDAELLAYLAGAEGERSAGGVLDGVAVAGDFNEDADELAREDSRQGVLRARGFEWDGVLDVTETRTGRKIDWVFYRPLTPAGAAPLTHADITQDLTASDHALTGLDLP